MTKEQLAIAKEALYQYEMIRIKKLEALPETEFQLSQEYEKKKEELREQIKNNTLKPTLLTGKQKLCIIAAATLILALIVTACTFGNQIKGFFVNFFDSFSTVQPSQDATPSLKVYSLKFIPENYVETSKAAFNGITQIEYSKNENIICFKYYPASYFYSFVDTQQTTFEIADLDGTEIYYNLKNNVYTIYWVNDDATFYISCDTSIEWSDIEKMILSVKCEE